MDIVRFQKHNTFGTVSALACSSGHSDREDTSGESLTGAHLFATKYMNTWVYGSDIDV